MRRTYMFALALAALAAPARAADVICHNCPPQWADFASMDVQNLRNADTLASVVRRHPRVRLIAAGHVHRASLTTVAGIAATICPAPNHAVALHLDARWPPSFKIEPPAFHLHAWFPGDGYGSVVTHLVPIGEFAGPWPFHGSGGRLL
jgi:3',5'-cyclic-AMP phosphodiesterase